MNKKKLYQMMATLFVAMLCISFASCGGGDDDEEDISGGSSSSRAKVSLSLKGSGTDYTATVTVSGVNASEVIVLGVRAEPQSTSGYKPGKYFEAGSRSTTGTCKVKLERGTTYFIYGYANVNGTRVESAKQTKTVR